MRTLGGLPCTCCILCPDRYGYCDNAWQSRLDPTACRWSSCSLTTSHKRTTSPPLCCLSVIQLESSVALLCWEKTNYLHGLTEGRSQTRRPVPSAGSSLSIEIVRFQGRTRRGASVPTLLEVLLLTLIFPWMSENCRD